MPDQRPLAAAQRRLGRPGRPRKPAYEPVAVTPCPPRLLDAEAAAAYLGVSSWTIRDLDAVGVLPRVRVPLPNGGALLPHAVDQHANDVVLAARDVRHPANTELPRHQIGGTRRAMTRLPPSLR